MQATIVIPSIRSANLLIVLFRAIGVKPYCCHDDDDDALVTQHQATKALDN